MNVCIRPLICVFFLISVLFAGGCLAIMPSPVYDIGFSTPRGEPVYIERVIYDDTWIGRAGIMLCCWKTTGAVNSVHPPRPVPKEIFIRWFNYRQQKYYEATVLLPKDAKLKMLKLPETDFGCRTLTTGVLPSGEVVVWASNGWSERTGTWVEVARTQGHVAKGDPNDHRSQTEEMKERGEI